MPLLAYGRYENIDLPWIDSLPEEWNIKRGKNLLQSIDIRSNTGKEELLTVSSKYGVIPRKTATVTMFKADSYVGYKLCWENDLVINSLWAWAGGLGVTKEHGIISSAYGVYRIKNNKELHPDYLHALMRSSPFQWELQIRSKGIWTSRLQLTDESFLNAPILIPPLDDQKLISRYLTHINNKIQKYIAAKKKLIKLLEEQKKAIIHQAVTGKIDVRTGRPYTQYNEADFPWVGNIPNAWKITRLKNEFNNLNNIRIPLSSSQRGEMTIREYDYYGASGVIDKVENYIFDDELLLIAEDGANLVLRNLPLAIIAKGKFWVNNHAHILKPKNGNIVFLANVLECLDFRPWISGAAQPKLTKDRLMSISIAIPKDRNLQEEIVDWFKRETSTISTAINKTKREISLLSEYSVRLISDVVTGKVDVREATKQIPEDIEEAIDDTNDEIDDDIETVEVNEE